MLWLEWAGLTVALLAFVFIVNGVLDAIGKRWHR